MMKTLYSYLYIALILTFVAACNTSSKAPSAAKEKALTATATISGKSGQHVQGTIVLIQVKDGVTLQIDLTGLEPNSLHGFHIHEIGDCTDDDAKSAGGHFNPGEVQHGGPEDQHRHAGDMGNLHSDAKGEVHTLVKNRMVTLDNQESTSVVNRAIIIHESKDQFDAQPAGNAGARIGCGVIRVNY
ncbi:MAG: superoxide dismutase family protein [Bdellovibrionales bacterium]|nr:superoxide dismutase family protein [Bdellovibrionales bacterium]